MLGTTTGSDWRRRRHLVAGALAILCHAGRIEASKFPTTTPEVGTLAYVVTRCSLDSYGAVLEQELRVQRGDSAPWTVVSFRLVDIPRAQLTAVNDFLFGSACRFFGQDRAGGGAELAAPINRVRVSPNGRHVVFHVSDAHIPLNDLFHELFPQTEVVRAQLPAETHRGHYVADADGAAVEWVGYESKVPDSSLNTNGHPTEPEKWTRRGTASVVRFSPDSRYLTYVDYDQEPSSPEARLQVMLLDVIARTRVQLTQLTAPQCRGVNGYLPVSHPRFLDRHKVVFGRDVRTDPSVLCDVDPQDAQTEECRIDVNGSGLACAPLPRIRDVPVQLDPDLAIIGRRLSIFTVSVGASPDDDRPNIAEIFLRKGHDVLQLTNLGSSSTRERFVTPNGARVFFITSADPFGTNPNDRCELFSVGTRGNDMRQITRFNHPPGGPLDGPEDGTGCRASRGPGCTIGSVYQDPVTRALVFMSNCDLLNTGAFGEHVFTMWPDGSGIRQLTHESGCVGDCRLSLGRNPAGFTRVEQPGFLSYAPRHGRARR